MAHLIGSIGHEGTGPPRPKSTRPKKKRKRAPWKTPRATLGGEGVRQEQRQARRVKRLPRAPAFVRRSPRRATLRRLNTKIRNLEARRRRLSLPTIKPRPLVGPDPAIRRARKFATVERELTETRAKRDRIAAQARIRQGRRAVPVTALEVGLELASAIPPLRGVGIAARLAGLGAGVARRGAPKVASGVGRAESRALRSAAGKKVKPLQRGTKGPARRKPARQARRKQAGEPRTGTRVPRSKREAKARAQRQFRKRQPAVLTREGRQVRRRTRAQALGFAGAASPPAAALVTETARRFAEAIADDPEAVAKTTARVIPAMATAIASLPVDVAAAVIQGDTGPLRRQGEAQLDYWQRVAEIAGEDPVAARRAIQEDVGLIPALSAGLTGFAVGRFGAVPKPSVRGARVRQLERAGRSPDRARRMRAERKLAELPATKREAHGQRVRESKRAAATAERIEKQFEREMRTGGRGRKRLDRQLEALHRRKLTEKVSMADVVQFLGREGLAGLDPKRLRTELARRRRALAEPRREIRPDDVATRDVIAALERRPEAASDPKLLRFLADQGRLQAARSVERHAERTGRRQRTPDPEDERARLMAVARAEGIPLPEQRIPQELRGVARTQAGVEDARGAIRGEATKARRSAKAGRQRARVEGTRARGAARELNVRRVADDRRVQVRSLDAGLRKLERRRAAWAEKARRARRPDTRARYQAKVRDLDEQIRFRRARLAMAASPARLRAIKRVTEHKARERGLRAEASAEEARAASMESVVNRERRAAGLERQAKRAEAAGRPGEAAELRAEAQALRQRFMESEGALRDEFVGEVSARIEERGLAQPIYFREADVTDKGSLNVIGDYPGSQIPKREHRRMGELARQGRIDEAGATLLEHAYRGRVAIEMRRHVRDFLDDRLIDVDGKLHTGRVWRRLQAEGRIPPGSALIPLQEFNRVLQRGAWEEAAGLLDDALRASVREARLSERKKYALVPRAALEEFRAQMRPWGKGLRRVRTLARIQSIALLAASPSWFAFQLLASPLAAFVSHPNPLRWAKVTKRYITDWRRIPKQERLDFQTQYGGTTAEAVTLQRAQIGLRPDTVRSMANAAGVALRSPVGRLLDSIAEHVRKGGPLIQLNRRYEARVRDLVALLEMDKQINPSRVLRFADAVGGAHKLVARDLAHLKNKPLRERVNFYARNPKAANRLTDAVDDALGNWNALTNIERRAAAVTVFFPFLRFSLRWVFLAFPKNNPAKAAILANLSQANAEQLEQLLGGAPSFFPQWGNIVIHVSEDRPVAIDLARSAPGSNAIVEAFGSSGINLASVTRPLQPVLGGLLTALAKQDPLSGRESKLSREELIARAIVGLPAPLRPVARQIGPEPSDYSKLFTEISGRDRDLAYFTLPRVLTDLGREREAVRASELMDRAFDQNDQEAREELDRMMARYGLTGPISAAREASQGTSGGTIAPWRQSRSSGGAVAPWRR